MNGIALSLLFSSTSVSLSKHSVYISPCPRTTVVPWDMATGEGEPQATVFCRCICVSAILLENERTWGIVIYWWRFRIMGIYLLPTVNVLVFFIPCEWASPQISTSAALYRSSVMQYYKRNNLSASVSGNICWPSCSPELGPTLDLKQYTSSGTPLDIWSTL